MKISLFVHELLPQVGHSRAMLELMNGLSPEQKKQVELIEAVCCETQDLDALFPDFPCPKKRVHIPGGKLKPFILKMFFYHVFTSLYCLFFGRGKIKIGIGIACLHVDIANIQFIHDQWRGPFFSQRKMNLLSKLYKTILFAYFHLGEVILFKNQKRQFIVIAHFLQDFIQQHFGTSSGQFTLIPSGVNTKEFSLPETSAEVLFEELKSRYPALSVIDLNRPVCLFVGAFERKGLDKVLSYLRGKNQQLILIGKPESFSSWSFPPDITIAHIPFTREVQLFYAIADLFIFPTYYEPFGLVILEAYAMGLDLIVPRDNVGASEILKEGEGIHFFYQKDPLPEVIFRKISRAEKLKRRDDRLQVLSRYTWRHGASQFYSILSKY